jgi:hypothetical protein
MLGGLLTVSAQELDRLGVVRRVLDGRMRLTTAAEVMGITTRQARRGLVVSRKTTSGQ